MTIRIILLLLSCLVLIGCQSETLSKRSVDTPKQATNDDKAAAEEEAVQEKLEPLTQRIRRVSPRRYINRNK